MGKVIYPRKGEVHTAPVTIPAVFADATWAQIIEACETNTVPDTWEVGDQKVMTINGTDYLIDIIGKNHDAYSDGSGYAPLTFQMHDCYGTRYKMHSTNDNTKGWENCEMRTTTLPTIFALMPTEVQARIKEVNKQTGKGQTSNPAINTTADKLFLLSEKEVFGSSFYSAADGCKQYAYYAAGNSAVKNLNGSAYSWWERSPNDDYTTGYCQVSTSGKTNYMNATSAIGIAFAFCF